MRVGSTSAETNGSQLLRAAAEHWNIFQYADLIYVPGQSCCNPGATKMQCPTGNTQREVTESAGSSNAGVL